MKFMVLGSGGREHALSWKLAREGHELVCAPGNAGTARIAEQRPVDVASGAAVVVFCSTQGQ